MIVFKCDRCLVERQHASDLEEFDLYKNNLSFNYFNICNSCTSNFIQTVQNWLTLLIKENQRMDKERGKK